MNKTTPIAVDLFCGCGGISVGIENAGYKVIAGIDIEKKYISSFKHNFPNAQALTIDITTITPNEFMMLLDIKPTQLDLLVGGPPCQGFSKNVPRKNRFLEDPKNLLVRSFLDYCEALKPEMLLMENVAEMKNGFEEAYSQEIISRLNDAGYTITTAVLNAADYGIPQRRRRAFFLANRLGFEFSVPPSTHKAKPKQEKKESIHQNRKGHYHITVWDAIGDLPSVKHGEGNDSTLYLTEPQNSFQKIMRNDCKKTSNHIARKLSAIQLERLSSIGPGQGLKDLPPHLQTKGGYSGAYGRLTKETVAPTITRWVFHPGSGRWGHPIDIRTLTIREAARIQSFPDKYHFVGSYTEQAGQLGNAVPPLLAELIIKHMKKEIYSFKNKDNSSHSTFLEGSLNAIA